MRIYWLIFLLLPILPFVIAGVAVYASLQMSKRRWIVHLCVLLLIALAFPLYLRLGEVHDPTLDEMNGGEMFAAGFIMLFYVFTGALTLIGYSIFAWCTRRSPRALAPAS